METMDEKKQKQQGEPRRPRIQHGQIVTAYLVIYDIFAVCVSYFAALWIRFDCRFQEIPMFI